jgi:CHAT domain
MDGSTRYNGVVDDTHGQKPALITLIDRHADTAVDESISLGSLAIAEHHGSDTDAPVLGEALSQEAAGATGAVPRLEVTVQVVWGDVTMVNADVYGVGHYVGIRPMQAELALDEALSGVRGSTAIDERRLVITEQTRRGTLHADVGDISFFPWDDGRNGSKAVAVAGMGRPGTFDTVALRRLVSALVVAATALPTAETLCTVLVGCGEGTMTIAQAVRGWLDGVSDAFEEIASSRDAYPVPVHRIVFAERERGRAEEILEELAAGLAKRAGEGKPRSATLTLDRRLKRGSGGIVSVEESIALMAEALLRAASAPSRSAKSAALQTLIAGCGPNEIVRGLAIERLRGECAHEQNSKRPRFRVERRSAQLRGTEIPGRISFWDDGQVIRSAAIHQAATVPERIVDVAHDVVDDLVAKMTDPAPGEVRGLCDLMIRLLLPAEFEDVLSSGSLVFEVDRELARLHWEMLALNVGHEQNVMPLAVRKPVARQLRTTYSPAPTRPSSGRGEFRALVIGDPGDPQKGEDLPGSRVEALRVKELLEARGCTVDARIGAPSVPRDGPLAGVKAADRLDVLSLLLCGDYDLVHYSGHGDFDPEQPNRVGWVFERGLLTPGEIGRPRHVPAIIVANACLSARTSQMPAGARTSPQARSEAGLLPTLADQFFKLGVRNYVGAAWEVDDAGAELFARIFYGTLLDGESFGEAVRRGREALWRDRDTYGALWAAYQHYGDPASAAGLRTRNSNDG